LSDHPTRPPVGPPRHAGAPGGPPAAHDPPRGPAGQTSAWGRSSRSSLDEQFLAGPESRWRELKRALRILVEFVRGFRRLHFMGPAVTIFGSARFPEEHRYYVMARELAAALGRSGFTILTGGGPGVMEAANRGARDVGAPSVGCNILLPHEQRPNAYVDTFVEFHYFFVRKVMLVKYSYAFVALPGGFGTLDEIFETVTLVQTGKIRGFPLVLMGRDYWAPLLAFMRERMLAEGTILAEDIDRLLVTDDPEEASAAIVGPAMERFGLARRLSRQVLLGEGRRKRRLSPDGRPVTGSR